MKSKGYIYILTNPSFPSYVKIGYADDVERRVKQLNQSECTPFAFQIYATYEVAERLQDKSIHKIIDKLNPNLRSIQEIDGKTRVREFYAMAPGEALDILKSIASINGLEKNIKVYAKTKEEKEDEKNAKKIAELSKNRHHFKEIDFSSSLTGKNYHGSTNDDGTLRIVDIDTQKEIKNNAKPSKKDIIGQALKDLGEEVEKDETLYQRYHRLTKIINKAK